MIGNSYLTDNYNYGGWTELLHGAVEAVGIVFVVILAAFFLNFLKEFLLALGGYDTIGTYSEYDTDAQLRL